MQLVSTENMATFTENNQYILNCFKWF